MGAKVKRCSNTHCIMTGTAAAPSAESRRALAGEEGHCAVLPILGLRGARSQGYGGAWIGILSKPSTTLQCAAHLNCNFVVRFASCDEETIVTTENDRQPGTCSTFGFSTAHSRTEFFWQSGADKLGLTDKTNTNRRRENPASQKLTGKQARSSRSTHVIGP
ncbi:hypothetical protein BCV70DRAFT_95682 [Testicularia cyperi]|uniref:Uncharacterized protein n=1 Tax=Testicularia cyperi TaxID=1882483 RepID=A0A317XRC5_9BASI|nr:hypothetical protein BCV70DRAFT_95682 [Testicularia cyperi]